MGARRIISREDILRAMRVAKSGHACSRYLSVDWHTLRAIAKQYKTDDGTQTLYEAMINPNGKGIPKFKKNGDKPMNLLDIIEGRIKTHSHDPLKIKYRLMQEGYLKEECAICGFNERRVIDYKIPLLLHHKDGNKDNFVLDNLQLLCYNHYYLFCADILNRSDERQIDTNTKVYNTSEASDWELDDYHLERLRELGLMEREKDEDDPYDLVSRK